MIGAVNLFVSEITAQGKAHLDALIRSIAHPDEYVKKWDNQLTILVTIAVTQPQAAYLAFTLKANSTTSLDPFQTSATYCYL